MSKLPIPAAALIGTPLSMEDLKQIIGGSTHTCFCTWKVNDETTQKEAPKDHVWTEEKCMEQCASLCAGDPSCKEVETHYSMNP